MTSFSAQTSVLDGPAYPEPQSPAECPAPPGWDLGPSPSSGATWRRAAVSLLLPRATGRPSCSKLRAQAVRRVRRPAALTTPPPPHLCGRRSQLPSALPRAPVPRAAHTSAHRLPALASSGQTRSYLSALNFWNLPNPRKLDKPPQPGWVPTCKLRRTSWGPRGLPRAEHRTDTLHTCERLYVLLCACHSLPAWP